MKRNLSAYSHIMFYYNTLKFRAHRTLLYEGLGKVLNKKLPLFFPVTSHQFLFFIGSQNRFHLLTIYILLRPMCHTYVCIWDIMTQLQTYKQKSKSYIHEILIKREQNLVLTESRNINGQGKLMYSEHYFTQSLIVSFRVTLLSYRFVLFE